MGAGRERLPRFGSLIEWLSRQVYWRASDWLNPLRDRLRGKSGPAQLTQVDADFFRDELLAHIPAGRSPLLVHSSMGGFELLDKERQPLAGLSASAWLLGQLKQFVGAEGTLCMPTHPKYVENPGFMYDKSTLVLTYDVRRTPSNVGLLSELFRRQPGCQRSEHPLSAVAARGPLAEILLRDNLNVERPLPHGIWSPYYRICQHGGLVVGIGLSLIKAMTILHVAEEVADRDWPVKQFFYERRFVVIDALGGQREVTVRERRPEFVRSLMLNDVRRDLSREGLLKEFSVGGVACAIADAQGVYQYMHDRQQRSTYPYLWPSVARWGRALRKAPVGSKIAGQSDVAG